VRAASFPTRVGERGADRLGQLAVGVGGDQGDAGQAAGGQIPQERQPSGAVLGRGDLQAEISRHPSPFRPVAAKGVHVHDPPRLEDLQHQTSVRQSDSRPRPPTMRHEALR
jgi:hypothetical protein